MHKKLEIIMEQAPAKALTLIKENKEYSWSEDLTEGRETIREMIGTDDGARAFVEKTTYDMYQGREEVPLIYRPFYELIQEAGLPRVLTVEEFGPTQVVFLEHLEGGETKFGQIGPGTEKTVRLHTYSAGLEYSEDMIEYNEFWRLTDGAKAFGRAYNHLLNHLHLYPIISATYTTTGSDLEDQYLAQRDDESPVAQLVEYDTSIQKTLLNALQVMPEGSKLLVNSFDKIRVEEALAAAMLTDLTPNLVKRTITMDDIVAYDGATIKVGKKRYSYAGVTKGEAYLMAPNEGTRRSYVKHGLRISGGDGDLSRLIPEQLVGRSRLGVMATLAGPFGGVVKVELE